MDALQQLAELPLVSFHSSKEDSRAAWAALRGQGSPVSIPQRKIQETLPHELRVGPCGVSIPQRKIQEEGAGEVSPRLFARFHSSKEDSRGGDGGSRDGGDASVSIPQRKIQEQRGWKEGDTKTLRFHSSKEDSRAFLTFLSAASQRVSIPQRKIQENFPIKSNLIGNFCFHSSKEDSRGTRMDAMIPDAVFPFLKGRFKSEGAYEGIVRIFGVSIPQRKIQERSRIRRDPPGSRVSIPQRKIQEDEAPLGRGSRSEFPFLKGRFKRAWRPPRRAYTARGFHSSKEDSRGAPCLHERFCFARRFPFLKGRFKSQRCDTRPFSERRFHSSKEDSRVVSVMISIPIWPCFHSSKEDSRGGIGRPTEGPESAVSIPQRKIQESNAHARGARLRMSFPFLKGRFKSVQEIGGQSVYRPVSIPQRKIQEAWSVFAMALELYVSIPQRKIQECSCSTR